MSSTSVLSVEASWRPGVSESPGPGRTERHFWDFLVNGTSIRSLCLNDGIPVISESVGVLGWRAPEFEGQCVAKLLRDGPPDYPPDRVALYVCPECGDLGCGAITVAVRREPGFITWCDFRWEVSWYVDRPDEPTLLFDVAPFRFSVGAYGEVLNSSLRGRARSR